MSEIKMLPLPTRLAASGLKSEIVNFAERMVEHNVAARDTEIEALRAELDRLRGEHVRVRRDRNAAEARAKRLAEALREARDMVEDWAGYASEYFQDKHDLQGDLAKLDAALRDHDQEGDHEQND